MDDGRAASDAVMASDGAHHVAGNLNLRTTREEPPPRGALSLCYFLFGRANCQIKCNIVEKYTSAGVL